MALHYINCITTTLAITPLGTSKLHSSLNGYEMLATQQPCGQSISWLHQSHTAVCSVMLNLANKFSQCTFSVAEHYDLFSGIIK